MAEILATGIDHRRRAGVKRMKKHSLRTDMTPMVDLGFLLITFFVFTAQLRKPASMKLNMPKDSKDSMTLAQSNALTVLLDGDERIYYYHGDWKKASEKNEIFKTNFSETDGLGKIIREKQQWLDASKEKEKRDGLMLLIKAGNEAPYQKVIDALDEALINSVKKYALVKASPEELEWMTKQR